MVDRNRLKSEAFIHSELIERAKKGVRALYGIWSNHKHIDPFILLWPATPVKDKYGSLIDGPCIYELDLDKTKWRKQMVDAIELTNAYAMMFVQQREDSVLAILESPHGAVNWRIPIRRSGDTYVLGQTTQPKETEHIGLIWRPNMTTN